jgi:hypothetical protein
LQLLGWKTGEPGDPKQIETDKKRTFLRPCHQCLLCSSGPKPPSSGPEGAMLWLPRVDGHVCESGFSGSTRTTSAKGHTTRNADSHVHMKQQTLLCSHVACSQVGKSPGLDPAWPVHTQGNSYNSNGEGRVELTA